MQYNLKDFYIDKDSHPFDAIHNKINFERLLGNYLLMSQAFPYLQAGSQKELIFDCISENKDISKEMELTTVVANFLSWDETGGLYITLKSGLCDLSSILNTENFHSNLLKKDCAYLLGKQISPFYSETTKQYLSELYKGLSDKNNISRLAMMVSFEFHADKMIEALWKSLVKVFKVNKNKLEYFYIHVGGDDPAEEQHMLMTELMIDKIVKSKEKVLFKKQIKNCYKLHLNWCETIVKESEIKS